MRPDSGREEAAIAHWRPLMHAEGDHMSLIHIYNAYVESKLPVRAIFVKSHSQFICCRVYWNIIKTRSQKENAHRSPP